MTESIKKNKENIFYWLGNVAVGLLGLGVQYSDVILPKAFPKHTLVNQLAIPISLGLKFVWDSWKYRKGTISEGGKNFLDKITDKVTGEYGSKPPKNGELPGGLRK